MQLLKIKNNFTILIIESIDNLKYTPTSSSVKKLTLTILN